MYCYQVGVLCSTLSHRCIFEASRRRDKVKPRGVQGRIVDREIPIAVHKCTEPCGVDVDTMYPKSIRLLSYKSQPLTSSEEGMASTEKIPAIGSVYKLANRHCSGSNHTEAAHMEGGSRSAPIYLFVVRIISSRARMRTFLFFSDRPRYRRLD